MDEKHMVRKMVDEYARAGSMQDGDIKLVLVQERKTTYVEPNGSGGQSIVMNEYKVDGKTYWAGYSTRSNTVYLSLAA